MTYTKIISDRLELKVEQVFAAIELFDGENTIPFIARYRKEVTGELDESKLRDIRDLLKKLRLLDERRETVLKSIKEQGKLTPELKSKLLTAETRTELEDLYQPYKPKRKTRADVARQRGLQPLADLILEQPESIQDLEQLASGYQNDELITTKDVWAGARDIVAETISDHPHVRQETRLKALQWGTLLVEKIDQGEDPRAVYKDYYEFKQRVDYLRPHQILAINRGEKEKVLRVKVEISERDWRYPINNNFAPNRSSPLWEQHQNAAVDAAQRLLLPAIERDVRRVLTETAEKHAIEVFVTNLRALLMQPPITDRTVMGIDPGFRTGCKVAVVNSTGKPLATSTIYPHEPQKEWNQAKQSLVDLITQTSTTLVAIGNGTASRETERLVAEMIAELPSNDLHYLIVSEAGASVYSASPLARTELPHMDVSMRGAVSIARRVLDPLSELVKIDPKSIGVGLYQHDVNQKELAEALDAVVESVVNQVGVDVNTASSALLAYVAGIGPKLALRIVEHRHIHGIFSTRHDLTAVTGLGPKSFEQAAGFLRIRTGESPLDESAIHPESYSIAVEVLRRAHVRMDATPGERQSALGNLQNQIPLEVLAVDLGTGIPTLKDIFEQLVRPGRDPREDLPSPILRSDVLSMEDLSIGMELRGTVRNVVDFGAFIDIGVKYDGLLHRTQIPQGIKLSVGDLIDVTIQKVEIERHRISLGFVRK